MTREIPLTRGQVALVDDADYEWLSQWKWSAQYNPYTKSFYAVRRIHNGKAKPEYPLMHRLILNAAKGVQVDHKNRMTTDNRRDNLRLCTIGQNRANAIGQPGRRKSLYKGIWWCKKNHKWRARIQCREVRIHLGYFLTETAAAQAYNAAALTYFGEFACLNQIDGASCG
jgi:hypothetical protein